MPNVNAQEFLRQVRALEERHGQEQPIHAVNPAAEMIWMHDFMGNANIAGGNRRAAEIAPIAYADEKRMENGPELWEKILTAVREIYEPAYVCIAGGAIRDGKEAKDIDVFINLPDDKFDAKDFMNKAEELGWRHIQKVGQQGRGGIDPYLKDNKRGLTQAVCKGIVDGWQVDLIVTKATDGEKVVGGFDFHICEQWFDGETHRTKAAIYDMKKGQWTPSRPLTTDTKDHFERVNKRLEGKYKLNIGEPWYMKFQGKEKLK